MESAFVNIKLEREENCSEFSEKDDNIHINGEASHAKSFEVIEIKTEIIVEPDIVIDEQTNTSFKNEPAFFEPIKQEPDTEQEYYPEECIIPDVLPETPSMNFINHVSEELLKLTRSPDGKYLCPICHKSFVSRANVNRHITVHTRQKYDCTVCFKQFIKKDNLDRHLLTHTTEKRFKCAECGKSFRTTSNLDQHKKTHLEIKPFRCDKCERQFAVKSHLMKHLAAARCKHRVKLICHVCQKVFTKNFLLQSHLRRHDTERPFNCEICKMPFKYKSTLIRHVQLHKGIKPFSCKICRKTFTHAGLIKPHMRKHTGEKPYQCPECKRMFAHKHNMQRHLLGHAKVKNLVCDVCNKIFPKESRLKYHMRTHAKVKPFVCKVCCKKFSHKQNLVRHYGRKHPNEKVDCPMTDAGIAKDIWDDIIKKKMAEKDLVDNIEKVDIKQEISDCESSC